MFQVSNSKQQSERHAPSDFTIFSLSCIDSLQGGISPFFVKNLLETEKVMDVTAILKHSHVFNLCLSFTTEKMFSRLLIGEFQLYS